MSEIIEEYRLKLTPLPIGKTSYIINPIIDKYGFKFKEQWEVFTDDNGMEKVIRVISSTQEKSKIEDLELKIEDLKERIIELEEKTATPTEK